jgi:hypothetical protein
MKTRSQMRMLTGEFALSRSSTLAIVPTSFERVGRNLT